jgi:hypothetical protein
VFDNVVVVDDDMRISFNYSEMKSLSQSQSNAKTQSTPSASPSIKWKLEENLSIWDNPIIFASGEIKYLKFRVVIVWILIRCDIF